MQVILLLSLTVFCGWRKVTYVPISVPVAETLDARLIGTWKLEEDTNHNNFYQITRGDIQHTYHIKFWDRGGTNPTYESFTYFSVLNGSRFINVPYFDRESPLRFILLRILEEDKDFTKGNDIEC
jgi:hypothetical protein